MTPTHRVPDPVDEAIETAGWLTQSGPRYVKHVSAEGRRRWRRGPRHWRWDVVEEIAGEVLASGRSWSRHRAWKRAHRAYERILRQRGAES